MARYFLTAVRFSLLQGPIVAAGAFPLGILMVTAFIALFYIAPLLLIIPFFGKIVAFLLTLVVWTAAARFAGSLAGIETRGKSFAAAFWAAFPVVLVIKIAAAVLSTAWSILTAEFSPGLRTLNAIASLATVLETVVIVVYVVKSCCSPPRGTMPLHTPALFLARYGFGVLVYVCVFLLTWGLIAGAIEAIKQGLLTQLEGSEQLNLLSVTTYTFGVVQWLLAGLLLSLEANLYARAPRPKASDDLSGSDARDLRAQWNQRP
ncbi:MAG: hypothetical protein AAGC81_08700 [Pseudomonadota bacterium]